MQDMLTDNVDGVHPYKTTTVTCKHMTCNARTASVQDKHTDKNVQAHDMQSRCRCKTHTARKSSHMQACKEIELLVLVGVVAVTRRE